MRARTLAAAFVSVLASAEGLTPAAQVFHSTAELVVLHVTVTDRSGRDVRGLPPSAFTVLEDGVPQTIRFVADEDSPVTLGLVVDGSVSMWGIRDQVLDAAGKFAEAARAQDELFALAFNEAVWPALRPTEPFTSDASVLRRALAVAMTSRGKTALFDAVSTGLDYATRGSYPREILVVISDGGDNASAIPLADVLRKAESSNVVVYTVALADRSGSGATSKPLRQLADATGGRMFTPSATRDIDAALQAIARDVRHAYTIAYAPTRQADGALRRVSVTAQSAGATLVARTRAGYRAPAADAAGGPPAKP